MANYNIEEAKRLWQEEPEDKAILRAATENINEYPAEIQAIIQGEAKKRGLINEDKVVTPAETEKAIKPKKTGKQRARTIALILIILVIIAKITDIAKGNYTPYVGVIDMAFEALIVYCLVMFVAYPIARRVVRRRNPKDGQN